MKEFKNVPSKLYEKTNDWITKEKNLTKTKYTYPETKPKPRRIMSASHHRIAKVNDAPPFLLKKIFKILKFSKKIITKAHQCLIIITIIKWSKRN